MKYIRDNTGRFPERPFYTSTELDVLCEEVVTAHVVSLHGRMILPIRTDDLTKLIERDAADLDCYADLDAEGVGVEGVTDFLPGEKPRVRISQELGEPYLERRLRTTLTHEYGHVKLHDPLFQSLLQRRSLPDLQQATTHRCHREGMMDAPSVDWMEWQAGYACGALLMPATLVRELVTRLRTSNGIYSEIEIASPFGFELKEAVAKTFFVSREAAQTRLLKLGYLVEHPVSPTLF